MIEREKRLLLGMLAALGVLLRVTDLGVPDFATDEAQAALASSAAWTPLGMGILKNVTMLFGQEIIVARSVSALFGIACLPLIYLLTREMTKKTDIALLATVIAALFPTHILFSRLAYLSIQECFWWLVVLYAFLKAKKEKEMFWYLLLFAATVASTMTKTQDILLPAFLVIGRIIELRMKVLRDTLSWILIIACIPFGFFFLTHPGISATLFLYGGNMYGVSGPFARIIDLATVWWKLLGIYLIAMAASLPALRTFPWPFHALLLVAVLTGYLLGPGHEYYATHLVFFSIPIATALLRSDASLRIAAMGLCTAYTLLTLGPTSLFLNPWTNHLYQKTGFWNQNAAAINDLLKEEEAVTVLGDAGHHFRWYLAPRVLVGRDMIAPYQTQYLILTILAEAPKAKGGTVILSSEELALVKLEVQDE